MAFIECRFFSETLGMSTSMNVILPQETTRQIGMEGVVNDQGDGAPVLMLLHGLSDDHSIWMRRTSIERYAAPLGLAVVMPEVQRSWYNNTASGMNYWDFISQEVLDVTRSLFQVTRKPEKTFVAGLSMGGYGAFKLELTYPEKFAAAGSLSGVMDINESYLNSLAGSGVFPDVEMKATFGEGTSEGLEDKSCDLLHLLREFSKTPREGRPSLYQCCGREDRLSEGNHRFRDLAQELKVEIPYEEDEGFDHSWDYWDLKIQKFLQTLPL